MTNLKMEIYETEVKPMKIYVDDFFDTITFTFLYVLSTTTFGGVVE